MNLPTLPIPIPKIKFGLPDLWVMAELAMPAVAIVVSIGVVFLVTWPRFTEVLKLRGANKQLVQQAEKLALKTQKLEGLDESKLDLQLGAAEQLLPSDKGVFTFIRQIEQAGNASGVLLSRIDVTPGLVGQAGNQPQTSVPAQQGGEVQEAAPKIQVRILASSDYRSLLLFLSRILAASRIATIGDLGISAGTSSSGAIQLRSAFTINAYWQSLPTQLSSVESEIEELTSDEETLLAKVNQAPSFAKIPSVPVVPLGKSDLFTPF